MVSREDHKNWRGFYVIHVKTLTVYLILKRPLVFNLDISYTIIYFHDA